MSEEHPVQQPIRGICIVEFDGGWAGYDVGKNGVTLIEPCIKPGEYCNIPYVRVWKGDVCEGEFCQHRIMGVYFAAPEAKS